MKKEVKEKLIELLILQEQEIVTLAQEYENRLYEDCFTLEVLQQIRDEINQLAIDKNYICTAIEIVRAAA